MMRSILAGCIAFAITISTAAQEPPDRATVTGALHRSVTFFRQHASAGGGYVFQISADLSKREGEGKVNSTTAWIEPPATPAVGMAYLDGYRMCGDRMLFDAALETADALVNGQLRSGGWGEKIDFDPKKRSWQAYRVESESERASRNTTTFDDDKTQSAIRFLVQIDRELQFKNETIQEAAHYALGAVMQSQYPCGAWPQKYNGNLVDPDSRSRQASFDKNWPHEFPNKNYQTYYTLNDNTVCDLITTLLDAWEVYDDDRYLKAAQRGGDFLLLAQLPEPQPGWAQQYNRKMQPAWARRFEPPAITGGESQRVMRTLIELYRRTTAIDVNAERYLKPLPRAIEYYKSLVLPDGRIARFQEIGTDRPLYFTKDYKLTYQNDDLPTHYAFIVGASFDSIGRELESALKTPKDQLHVFKPVRPKRSPDFDQLVLKMIDDMDDRGAWVEPGKLNYHGADDSTRTVIRSATFSTNIQVLAKWLAAK